jgi:hypothetical protein
LPSDTLYKPDAMGIPEYDYPAVVVRNTFLDTKPDMPASLVGFFRERETHSAPGSRVGAPPGLEGQKSAVLSDEELARGSEEASCPPATKTGLDPFGSDVTASLPEYDYPVPFTIREAVPEDDDFGSGMSVPPGLISALSPGASRNDFEVPPPPPMRQVPAGTGPIGLSPHTLAGNLGTLSGSPPAETGEVLRLRELVDSLRAENQALKMAGAGPGPVAPPKAPGLPLTPPPPAPMGAQAGVPVLVEVEEAFGYVENGSAAAVEEPYKAKAWPAPALAPMPPAPSQWAPMLPQAREPPPPTVIADSCVVPQEQLTPDAHPGGEDGAEGDIASASASSHLGTKELPTLGSAGHHQMICKPCAFFHKKGCNNGVQCLFCHLCEPGEIIRRKKDKLERQRQTTQWLRTPQHVMPMPQPMLPMLDPSWAANAPFLAR